MVAPASSLARYLCAAYFLLVVYGSLHPFSGWQDRGTAPFAFLAAPLPRYVTAFDLVANIIAYLPLGFLAVLALHPVVRGTAAAALALAGSLVLSVAMETLQTYLPARIPSNLDVLTNGIGALAGAFVAVRFAPTFQQRGSPLQLRHRWFAPGRQIDLGLVLLGLWLFAQLDPETLLFGTGDLRDLFHQPSTTLYPAEVFIRIEAATAACNLVAVALFTSTLAAPSQPVRMFVLALLAGALAVRTLAFAVLFRPPDLLLWVTPGALLGLAAGLIVAPLAVALPHPLKLALAGLALMAATALVNLAPANPYLTQSLQVWQQGQFLNFNGLTHLVSDLWPFAALAYLLIAAGGPERGTSA